MLTAAIGAGAALAAWLWLPSSVYEPIDYGGKKPIFYRGELLQAGAAGEKESLKLPLSVIRETVDPDIVYEEASDSVIVTTKDKVVRFKTDLLTATVNEKPVTLRFPVEKLGEDVYVPLEPLKELYGLVVEENPETGALLLRTGGDTLVWGKVVSPRGKPRALRHENSIKSAYAAEVPPNDEVLILGESEGWYRVQLRNGWLGYMSKRDIAFERTETIPVPEPAKPFIPWKPMGGKINLTWEQVEKKTPNMSGVPRMPGLNVVSPTWFHLADGEGNLKNVADPAYVRWAHGQGLQVWALFSNSFDPKLTTAALSTYDKRMHMTRQLLSFAQLYQLQGINLDFENVSLQDKANLTQFVREMTPLLHEQGLVVSIDVTIKSNSENWSMFYDRPALGEIVDYMMVMTYDEHWAASPKAGSVASLPWVEKGITQIIQEDGVPPSKLVLGVPYYTRIWTETVKDGKTVVSSRAVGMETIRNLLAQKKLTPTYQESTGQHYVEYKESGNTIKIWIEDATSMKARAELVRKLGLAGIASWKRGLEKPDIWQVIEETLGTRP